MTQRRAVILCGFVVVKENPVRLVRLAKTEQQTATGGFIPTFRQKSFSPSIYRHFATV